jgi:hypothetical protein
MAASRRFVLPFLDARLEFITCVSKPFFHSLSLGNVLDDRNCTDNLIVFRAERRRRRDQPSFPPVIIFALFPTDLIPPAGFSRVGNYSSRFSEAVVMVENQLSV